MRLTVKRSRVIPGLPGQSDLLKEGRLTQGFRCEHQVSKPGLIAYYKGANCCSVEAKSPQVTSLVALRLSRGVALVQIQPSPQVISLVALHRSRGVAMVQIRPSPQVIYSRAVLAGCLCLSCVVQQTLFGPL